MTPLHAKLAPRARIDRAFDKVGRNCKNVSENGHQSSQLPTLLLHHERERLQISISPTACVNKWNGNSSTTPLHTRLAPRAQMNRALDKVGRDGTDFQKMGTRLSSDKWFYCATNTKGCAILECPPTACGNKRNRKFSMTPLHRKLAPRSLEDPILNNVKQNSNDLTPMGASLPATSSEVVQRIPGNKWNNKILVKPFTITKMHGGKQMAIICHEIRAPVFTASSPEDQSFLMDSGMVSQC